MKTISILLSSIALSGCVTSVGVVESYNPNDPLEKDRYGITTIPYGIADTEAQEMMVQNPNCKDRQSEVVFGSESNVQYMWYKTACNLINQLKMENDLCYSKQMNNSY